MITQARLKERLYYFPNLGVFVWKERPLEEFKTERCGKMWNTRFAYTIAGYKRHDGYITIRIDDKAYYAHRLAWCYTEGYFPEHGIDHEDQCPNHNWISNLRPETQVCNLRNTGNRKNNSSGVKGIYWRKDRNKWHVQITVNGKLKFIGYHSDFTEAVFHRYCAEQYENWAGCDSNSPARRWLLERNLIKNRIKQITMMQ